MNILSIIEEAIKTRTPISFEYVRTGKTSGARVGDPHAAFIRRVQSGEERVYLHLWQTSGVTDSGQLLPSWRQFFLNDIANVAMLTHEQPFNPAQGYNPKSYEFPVAKV